MCFVVVFVKVIVEIDIVDEICLLLCFDEFFCFVGFDGDGFF